MITSQLKNSPKISASENEKSEIGKTLTALREAVFGYVSVQQQDNNPHDLSAKEIHACNMATD